MDLKSVERDLKSRKRNKRNKRNRIYLSQQQEILFKRIILIGGKMADVLRKSDTKHLLGEIAEDLVEQWDNLISEFVLSITTRNKEK